MDHDVTGSWIKVSWATESNVVLSFSTSSELLKHTVNVERYHQINSRKKSKGAVVDEC